MIVAHSNKNTPNNKDKRNSGQRPHLYGTIKGYKTSSFIGSTHYIAAVEEFKDPNCEITPLRTKHLNEFQGVDKDATFPKSNISRFNWNTTASRSNDRLQSHREERDEMYTQSKRNNPTWKIRSRNISAIGTAFIALVLCIGALIIGFSHVMLKSDKRNGQKETNEAPAKLFDEVGRYIFHDYDNQTPYSDLLPGLAGIYGKPLYAFFVNRGQGIASFGIESKNKPMLEFTSANNAYRITPIVGFRTFIQGKRAAGRLGDDQETFLMEPFSPLTTNFPHSETDDSRNHHPHPNKRILYSGENEMQLQEIDYKRQLETNVTYFILPEEDFGAFVRRTTITNTHSEESINVSFLDGLAKMEPAGDDINKYLKSIGRTLEGFMGVYFLAYDDNITMPFYRLSTSPADSEFVKSEERGHYCVSVLEDQEPSLLPIIYDPLKVFGPDTTLLRPVELFTKTIKEILSGAQYGKAKTPSCFAAVEDRTLQPGESITITTYFGEAGHILDVPVIVRRLQQQGFAQYKLSRTREVVRQITSSVETETASKVFDAHVSQMYLDNSLRGGIPIVLGDEDDNNEISNVDEDPRLKVFHVFSRVHGDLERDYNDFMLPSTFFSQGPGNFRDIAQNRRNDVVFNPKIGSFNIRMFLSFIQADGYEPHSVESIVFSIDDKKLCDDIATKAVGRADGHRAQREALSRILNSGPFRPGQLFELMAQQNMFLTVTRQSFIDMVARASISHPFAVYKEGYWADHWTYYLDMIESYLSIYPEEEERVMFDVTLPYFFSPAFVQPRSRKYVENLSYDGGHDRILQLDATVDDDAKREYMNKFIAEDIGWYKITAHWQHDQVGDVFESTVFAKLFLLATLKFATRDALGMGIEYEGGRPGWDDANNGIPGMLGSGMPETFELKALIRYLLRCGKKYDRKFEVPEELYQLFDSINGNLTELLDDYDNEMASTGEVPDKLFSYWDKVATAREAYREQTRIRFSGKTVTMDRRLIVDTLEVWAKEIDKGIGRAWLVGTKGHGDDGDSGIVPTYFSYRVTRWKQTSEHNKRGHPYVVPLDMTVRHFPLFLEGPTRMMKTADTTAARDIYRRVRNSTLFDEKLGMYTVSASLVDQPIEMGRSMAFAQGWLENQSVWLPMSYKFYLELLRHGLYDDFFHSMQEGGLLPFMDAKAYGRSLMQCSSFITSSVFEDPSVRGRGFLGRSSGSTAEFLSMWILMFIGPEPFYVDETTGGVQMHLLPTLPNWLFHTHDGLTNMGGVMMNDDGTPRVSFKLFSSINVHYYNKNKTDLLGVPPKRYTIGLRDGSIFHFNQTFIPTSMARKIRRVVFVDFIEAHF